MLSNVEADFIQHFCWKESVRLQAQWVIYKRRCLYERSNLCRILSYLLVPKKEPPLPDQPPTLFHVIGSIWQHKMTKLKKYKNTFWLVGAFICFCPISIGYCPLLHSAWHLAIIWWCSWCRTSICCPFLPVQGPGPQSRRGRRTCCDPGECPSSLWHAQRRSCRRRGHPHWWWRCWCYSVNMEQGVRELWGN